MNSEFAKKSLSECIELIIDCRGKTPKKLGGDWSKQGYRALSAKNVKTSGLVQESTIRRIDKKLYRKWMKEEVNRGDILLTSEAPLGQVMLWNSDEKIVLSQRLFAIRSNQYLDSAYLYYYMTSEKYQHELESRSTGTTVLGIKQTQLVQTVIKYPNILNQQKIAHILSTLDDKIELNRKMNQSLENMAQALFKSWFVDFDPVHAKENASSDADYEEIAKELGISLEVLDLFPDEFEESELGLIPKGWEVNKFNDIASVRKGLSYKGKHKTQNKDYPPMFNLGNFDRSGQYRAEKIAYYDGEYKERHLIRGGQLMMANTDMTQDRVILGLPIIVPELVDTDMIFTHHVFAIDFKSIELESTFKYYIFYTFINPKFREVAEGYATGTTVLALPKEGVMNFNLLLASKGLIDEFNKVLHSLISKMNSNRLQVETLQKTRDTLLPKLLSGELDVSELELDHVTH